MEERLKKINGWLDRINSEGRGLSDWEQHFVESVTTQLKTYGRVSDRQEEIVENIYANRTPM